MIKQTCFFSRRRLSALEGSPRSLETAALPEIKLALSSHERFRQDSISKQVRRIQFAATNEHVEEGGGDLGGQIRPRAAANKRNRSSMGIARSICSIKHLVAQEICSICIKQEAERGAKLRQILSGDRK